MNSISELKDVKVNEPSYVVFLLDPQEDDHEPIESFLIISQSDYTKFILSSDLLIQLIDYQEFASLIYQFFINSNIGNLYLCSTHKLSFSKESKKNMISIRICEEVEQAHCLLNHFSEEEKKDYESFMKSGLDADKTRNENTLLEGLAMLENFCTNLLTSSNKKRKISEEKEKKDEHATTVNAVTAAVELIEAVKIIHAFPSKNANVLCVFIEGKEDVSLPFPRELPCLLFFKDKCYQDKHFLTQSGRNELLELILVRRDLYAAPQDYQASFIEFSGINLSTMNQCIDCIESLHVLMIK